jgi:hypothetical protein
MMFTRLRQYLFGLLATLPLHAAAESIRLAPPQAMFKQSTTLNQFVSGTLRFVMLHELGHGLVDLYQIPVLGREEDAADRFATWWMSPDGAEDGTDAIAAVEWWMASGQQSDLNRGQLPWWDEHGMDEQRGFQIACLLYGADPQIMEPLAARIGLPKERRQSCIPEAQNNAASWSAYLRGQTVKLPHQLDGFLAPVNYLKPESVQTVAAASRAREMRLLEELQALLRQFKFPEGKLVVRLVAQDCGMANAFWSPGDRAMVLCYELVDHVTAVGKAAGFR